MAPLEDIRRARLAKLKLLQKKGVNPYPVSSHPTCDLKTASLDFDKLSGQKEVTLAGRVMALRTQGGLVFADLFDGTGKFQTLLKRDEMGEAFLLWSETVDIGDFVEVTGPLSFTKKREKTLHAVSWRMLVKALRQLPEKRHGLLDIEERFRRRYLDLLSNEEVRNRFLLRSSIVRELRAFLNARGFVEVETSVLQPLPGGANAEAFKTHLDALDVELYLRIATELDLKKLLVGGFPKVYEIGRLFRNEGIDVTHNPEYTTVEWYAAYSDASGERARVEEVVRALGKKVLGTEQFEFDGHTIDLAAPFSVKQYYSLFAEHGIFPDAGKAKRETILEKAESLGIRTKENEPDYKLLDAIYKRAIRPHLIQPTFVVDYPKDYIPLAKQRADRSDLVDAFQLVIGGLELVKAFSELNDPLEQAARFAAQEKARRAGDREAQTTDQEFIEALEYGMPPAGGVGLSIDRLTMLFGNVKNIREVILFPTLRPK